MTAGRVYRIALMVSCIGWLVACRTQTPIPPQLPESPAQRLPRSFPLTDVVVSLERDVGAEGITPAYRVELHGDGRILYYGYAYVAEAGMREATIDPQEVAELLRHLNELYFFEMPYQFSSVRIAQVRDGIVMTQGGGFAGENPSLVSVRIGDYEKRMIVSVLSPEEFEALPRMIDELAGTESWVR